MSCCMAVEDIHVVLETMDWMLIRPFCDSGEQRREAGWPTNDPSWGLVFADELS